MASDLYEIPEGVVEYIANKNPENLQDEVITCLTEGGSLDLGDSINPLNLKEPLKNSLIL